jgi:hypothetical protein
MGPTVCPSPSQRLGASLSPACLAAFTLGALLLTGSPTQAAPVIGVSSTTANIADIVDWVSVHVSIADAVDLYAYQFGIAFDPAILGLFDIVEGNFLPDVGATVFVPGAVGGTPGLIEFTAGSLLGPGPGANGSGLLFSVLFAVNQPGISPVSVVFDALNGDGLLDSELLDIADVGTSAGTVTIKPRIAPEPVTGFLLLTLPCHLRRGAFLRKLSSICKSRRLWST